MDTSSLIEKSRKPLLIFTGLVSVYALAGFVIIPKVMESKLPELIETETSRKTSIDKIEFNPFSLELSLQGFSMQEKDLQSFVSFKEFFVNVQVWDSLTNLALVIDEISLSGPYVRVEMLPDGRYNFSDLASDSKEEAEKESNKEGDIFPLIINQINLIQGKFETVNSIQTEPVSTLIDDLDFHLKHFSTLLGDDSNLGFSLTLRSGAELHWQGKLGVNPIFSTGKIAIEGLKFTNLWKFLLQDKVQFEWVDGTQLIKFDYDFSYADDEPSFKLTEGYLLTENLKFTAKGDTQEIIAIPYFSVEGITFDLNDQSVNIAKIESRDAAFDAWLSQSGELNYQTVFAGQGNKPAAEVEAEVVSEVESSEAGKPWDINIQELALNASKMNFRDKRPKEPVLFNIAALDLGLKNYHLLVGEQTQMTANQGFLNLQDFTLNTNQDSTLIQVPNLQVNELDFNLQEQSINIKSVNSRDAVIKSWLAKNGEINYQTLFAPVAKEQAEQVPPPESKGKNESPWKIALEEFKIDNYALEFTDHTPGKAVALNLSELNFSITQFNNQAGTQLPLSFSTRFNRDGKIKVSGHSILEPFSSDLKLAIRDIGIANFQPYINQSAKLDIVGGKLNTQGELAISQAKQGDLKLNYKGGIDIKGLHTRDQVLKQDFLKWQQLKFSGIDFDLQPTRLNIKSIFLDKPYSRFTIKKDKTTNISDVIIATESSGKKGKEVKKEPSPVFYKIARIKIIEGESDFSDYSMILPFVVQLNGLEGSINNISSNNKAKTKVDLKGKTFDLSPVDIQGSFNADLSDLDMAMHYKSLPLPFISPYMVEFSGDKIEKGKMSLDLMYQVKDGKLTAKNNLLIDQLELGEKVDNPDAVNLPLALAIALLKDKDGQISINMPLQGSMDDPEFSVGPLIFDAFVNLLTKVATSPFTAIGSFLDSDEDFSVVTFEAGSAEITVDQSVKLDGLATALTQKTDLSLEIKGEAYTNQDWPAMKELALMDQLKQMRSEELKKEGEIKLPEYIKLSEDEYQRLLADLFIRKFPDLAKRSLFGTPELIHPDMGEFYAVASNMLQSMIKPDKDKLLILSLTRARNIARYMNTQGKIDQSRVFVLNGRVTGDAPDNALTVNLALKVQ